LAIMYHLTNTIRCFRRLPVYAAISGLFLAGLLSGCQSNDEISLSGAPRTKAPIATVNGEPISASAMFDAMQHYVPVKNTADLNNPALAQPVGRVVLGELIQNAILVQLAKQKKVPVVETEVAQRYNYIKMLEEHSNTTKPFDLYLRDEGYSAQSFAEEQIKPLIARLNLVSLGQTISDADVKNYYDRHPEKYSYPAAVHIERLVLPNQAMAQAAALDARKNGSFKNFLGSNIDEPLIGGADSSDLAKWEPLNGAGAQFPPNILQPLLAAKAGDILAPMQLQQSNWWVIRVVAKQPAGKLPFDEIKSQVKLDALSEQGMRSISVLELQQALQLAVQTAKITVRPPQYQSLVVQLKAKPRSPAPAAAQR